MFNAAYLLDRAMPTELSTVELYEIALKSGYVEVRNLKAFALTISLAEAIWDEALALCKAHNSKAVLRIGPPPIRPMKPDEVTAVGARLDIPELKVAYCWDDYRPDKVAALFATSAMNKGTTVRYFCSHEAAIQWLTED